MIDYHFHSHFSGDSKENPENNIRKAIAVGLKYICFTDHHDYQYKYGDTFSLDLPSYFASLNLLKAQYKHQIDIGIGIELGLQPHLNDYFQSLILQYPFDFIIGSTHVVNGIDPYFKDEYFVGRPKRDAYIEYLQAIYANISCTDAYDSIGHLDYIVRYGIYDDNQMPFESYAQWIDPILNYAISHQKALEINTSGLRRDINHPHPNYDIINRYIALGGQLITLGSDAHQAEDLGSGTFQTIDYLKKTPIKYITVFEKRIPKKIAIN